VLNTIVSNETLIRKYIPEVSRLLVGAIDNNFLTRGIPYGLDADNLELFSKVMIENFINQLPNSDFVRQYSGEILEACRVAVMSGEFASFAMYGLI
jgi:hypothetical protein